MTGRIVDAWRRTGADPPWADPRGTHDAPMEGYYWRLVGDDGAVIVALCGLLRDGGALVALAADGAVATARGRGGPADARTLGVEVPGLMRASPSSLAVRAGDMELSLRWAGAAWPRRPFGGLGPAGALPGLSQYWHPHTLGARASGELVRGGRATAVSGLLYAEKNWGPGFPERWWWAEAHDAGTLVALAGGRVRAGPLALTATSLVLVHGGRLLRIGPPTGLVRSRVGGGRWRFRAWSGRDRVELEGAPGPGEPARLPFPAAAGAPSGTVDQVLEGTLALRWRRGRRLMLDTVLAPAGLEDGAHPGGA